MEQHIKLFSTDSARTTFESSQNYQEPYISKVAADNSVHYNKVPQIIEFTVHIWRGLDERGYDSYVDHTYQAVEGMTFAEWMNSEYSNVYATDTWVIDECDQFRLYYLDGNIDNDLGLRMGSRSNIVESSDTITSNYSYNTDVSTNCF